MAYSKEHFRSDFLDDLGEFFKAESFTIAEDFFYQSVNLLLRLNTVKENLSIAHKL